MKDGQNDVAGLTSLSIVVPIYNEEQILAQAVPEILVTLEQAGVAFEVILAENGSVDSTLQVAQDLAQGDSRVRVIHLSLPDYGGAMRQGFLASRGEFLVNFSIDFFDGGFVRAALSNLERFDVVLGSKYVAQSHDRRPLSRRVGGLVLSVIVRILFGLPVSDTHGLIAARRDQVIGLVERCRFGHEIFDTELIVRAHKAGLSLCEVPVRVVEERPSRLGTFRRAMRMLVQFARLRVLLWREGLGYCEPMV